MQIKWYTIKGQIIKWVYPWKMTMVIVCSHENYGLQRRSGYICTCNSEQIQMLIVTFSWLGSNIHNFNLCLNFSRCTFTCPLQFSFEVYKPLFTTMVCYNCSKWVTKNCERSLHSQVECTFLYHIVNYLWQGIKLNNVCRNDNFLLYTCCNKLPSGCILEKFHYT